jgi:hypoxanthine phosphoribosyltransferase
LKIVDWDEYKELLVKLYEKIKLDEFNEIVAIGRGGSIIGAFLASKLGIPTFYPIFLRHVGTGRNRRVEDIKPQEEKIKNLTGNILVVDDFLRDGLAIKYVLNLISKKASIKTLVMYDRKGSEFKPDFGGEYIIDTEITFPYDVF